MTQFLLCKTINKIAVFSLAIVLLPACGGIARTGFYSPVGVYAAIENKLPISIRTVGVVQAGSKGESFSEGELRRMEVELANSISNDMISMGVFRAPRPGEKPYLLDVEFPELSMKTPAASLALMLVCGYTLLTTCLLGMPVRLFKYKGEAVFKLYSPKEILVHETVTDGEKLSASGFYYGHTQSFGGLIAILVNKFKSKLVSRIDPVRMQKQVVSIYGNFKRTDSYNQLKPNQMIINSGPTQINNMGQTKTIQIEQNSNRNTASRK